MNSEYNDIEKIERYLEGKMEGEELAAFEKSLADDPDTDARPCGDTQPCVSVGDYQAAVNAIKLYNKGILKSRLKAIHKDVALQSAAIKKLRRWYWAAAVVVVLVGLGIATVLLVGNERSIQAEDSVVKLKQDVMPAETIVVEELSNTAAEAGAGAAAAAEKGAAAAAVAEKGAAAAAVAEKKLEHVERKLIAANYVKNPKYESLIVTVYRSADISILMPDTSASFAVDDTVVFSWKGKLDEEIILKIIDNHEKPVFEIWLRDVYKYSWTNNPDPGLYYWMLETEDDNLGYGRFLIR